MRCRASSSLALKNPNSACNLGWLVFAGPFVNSVIMCSKVDDRNDSLSCAFLILVDCWVIKRISSALRRFILQVKGSSRHQQPSEDELKAVITYLFTNIASSLS
jgi:hypothetical protein